MGVRMCGGCPNVLRMHAESERARAFFVRGGGAKLWVRPPPSPWVVVPFVPLGRAGGARMCVCRD